MEQHLNFIDQGLWITDLCVGGDGGYPFLFCAQHPFTVKEIRFYRDEQKIRGICVENWDGTMIRVGAFWDEDPFVVHFDRDEKITQCWLYSTKLEDGSFRFAGCRFLTDKAHDIECYARNYHPNDWDRKEFPVGTGVFCGIYGRASADIDCFGLCLRRY